MKCGIYYCYTHFEPQQRKISVHFHPFWSNFVYFSLFWSNLVHLVIGLLLSISDNLGLFQFSSVYLCPFSSLLSISVHFCPIRSTSVPFSLLRSILVHQVHFGRFWSISSIYVRFDPFWSTSVYFSQLLSNSVLFGPFNPVFSIESTSAHFGPLWSILIHFSPLYKTYESRKYF